MEQVEHAPGTFCWVELSTTDGPAAKKFYGELMGNWTTHDDPIPGGGVYTMIRMEGGNVGALFEINEEMRKQGVCPHWLPYVTVESAAGTAGKVEGLGGAVIKDAFDVMDVGAMAVLRDPAGAVFAVWQPKLHHGTHFTDGRPGSVCWNELATNDEDRCATFYGNLFGWKPTPMPMEKTSYTMFKQGEHDRAGMLRMTAEWGDVPPHWIIYFSVGDCDATAERAKRLGGQVCVPPTDIPPVGRFAVIRDPQGAVFSVIRLARLQG